MQDRPLDENQLQEDVELVEVDDVFLDASLPAKVSATAAAANDDASIQVASEPKPRAAKVIASYLFLIVSVFALAGCVSFLVMLCQSSAILYGMKTYGNNAPMAAFLVMAGLWLSIVLELMKFFAQGIFLILEKARSVPFYAGFYYYSLLLTVALVPSYIALICTNRKLKANGKGLWIVLIVTTAYWLCPFAFLLYWYRHLRPRISLKNR